MTEVLQADIFFFIASIATVIFLAVVGMVMFQIYKIMKLVRSILERIESASDVVADDIASVRQLVARGGIISSIFGLAMRGKCKAARSRKKAETHD